MKKKGIVFILALALLMLVAIPATAGPMIAAPVIQLPAFWTVPEAVPSIATQPILFEAKSPYLALALATPLAVSVSAIKTTYVFAVLATLAGLIWGMGLFSMTVNRRLKYDPRDRMHGLARDQDAVA